MIRVTIHSTMRTETFEVRDQKLSVDPCSQYPVFSTVRDAEARIVAQTPFHGSLDLEAV